MRTNRIALPTLAVTLAAALASCDGDSGSEGADTRVVATTTHVADLTRNVAGDRAEVIGLLLPGSDPHEYEPRPSDAQAFAEAELVLKSGGDLDIWVDEVAESGGGDAEVVELIDSAATIEGGHEHTEEEEHAEAEHAGDGQHAGEGHAEEERAGEHSEEEHAGEKHSEEEHAEGEDVHEAVDPHWWQDPQNAIAAVETIRDQLIAIDPEGEETYTENADAYMERLTELDQEVADCMEQISDDQRKLVTTHDAFGYFAEAYDVEVIGAAIPALTTQAQPSAGDTAELVQQIEQEDVNAIFPESGLNPQLEEAIAEETGAVVGGELWADTLGPDGSSGETYVKAMAHNAAAMAAGFSGGEASCEVSAAS